MLGADGGGAGTGPAQRRSPRAARQALPFFAGRWNDHLARYFDYDLEDVDGGVRSKVPRHVVEEEVASLQRTRLWVWQEEAEAMARAIPRCRLVVVEGSNHYTVLLGGLPQVRKEAAAFLAA